MDCILELKNATRRYQKHLALEGLDLSLKNGDILGLLGHNGAGKTTALKLMAGILNPSSGQVHVLGKKPSTHSDHRKLIGYLPELPALNSTLTVEENIYFSARLQQLPRQQAKQNTSDIIDTCQLSDISSRLVSKLSKGMAQRAALACTLVHKPQLVLLDEPASGLDPIQIQSLRTLIHHISKTSAIVISSHMLSEISQICNSYIILKNGKQVFSQDQEDTNDHLSFEVGVEQPNTTIQWPDMVVDHQLLSNQRFQISVDSSLPDHEVLSQLSSSDIQVNHFSRTSHSLEQTFIKYNL